MRKTTTGSERLESWRQGYKQGYADGLHKAIAIARCYTEPEQGEQIAQAIIESLNAYIAGQTQPE